mgnify:CR=1 FL=1
MKSSNKIVAGIAAGLGISGTFLGVIIIILGILLSLTLIGAIIGIPLIIIGILIIVGAIVSGTLIGTGAAIDEAIEEHRNRKKRR